MFCLAALLIGKLFDDMSTEVCHHDFQTKTNNTPKLVRKESEDDEVLLFDGEKDCFIRIKRKDVNHYLSRK